MRLIDADALKDEIAVLFERNPNLIDEWLSYQVEDAIDDAPTIEERKRGKWEEPRPENGFSYDIKAYAQCSVCGKKQFLGNRMNYCPNCGADMRGGDDGE